jgi:hypothetical protein
MAQAALPAAVAAGEGLYSGDWKKAAEYGAGAFLLPKAAQLAINSQGRLARAVTDAAATLGKPSAMHVLAGGAVQHLPFAALLTEQQRLSEPPGIPKKKEADQ